MVSCIVLLTNKKAEGNNYLNLFVRRNDMIMKKNRLLFFSFLEYNRVINIAIM